MNIFDLFSQAQAGGIPPIFNELDIKTEFEDLEAIQQLVSKFPKLSGQPQEWERTVRIVHAISSLEHYLRWMEHPIHINEFKDKYGHVYLQSRTSVKDESGKTKWISAYVGSLKEYPKGVEDPQALKKGKSLIRKKIKKYFGIL